MSQVDRGGLSYGIEVKDAFSSNLANFRSEVAKSRAAWKQFRDDFKATAAQTSKIRNDLKATTRELERRDRVLARSKTEGRRFARDIGIQTAAVRENSTAMQRQNVLALDRIKSLNTENRAVRRLTTSYRQLNSARRVAQRFNSGAVSGGFDNVSNQRILRSSTAVRARSREFADLAASTDKSERSANRASFTFRRLFGILAAFTIARTAVSGFNSLVTSAVTLNAELEQSVLGVAGLLTALGSLSDPSGVIVDNAERLTAAQGQARRQLEFLRVDALKTAASFQELADTFQIALAPGFQAGLDLDEIRRLTIRISQAASAIGLPQNQLPEEIRSLLSGTITPRTTRIATALGITNEDIRRAKEAGELVEFLEERFSAFAVAGDAALKNFSTIFINLRDGLGQILRLGGFTFFDALKRELNDILSVVATVNEQGNIIFNEEAIAVVEAIGEGLKTAVEEIAGLGDAFGLDDTLSVAKLIGKTISGIARTASPVIESLLTVLAVVSELINVLTSIGVLNDFVITILGNALAIAAAIKTILVVVGTIKSIVPVLVLQFKVLEAVFFGLTRGAVSFRAAMTAALSSFTLLAPLLGLAAIAFTGLRRQAEESQAASQRLVETLATMPSAISRSTAELEEQREVVEKLQEQFEEAANSFEVSVGTAGLSGAIKAQRTQQIQLQQQTRDLNRQSLLEEQRLDKLRLKKGEDLLAAERAINDLKTQGGITVKDTAETLEETQRITKEIADLNRRIIFLTDGQGEDDEERANQLKEQVKELEKQQEILATDLKRQVAFSLVLENDAEELLDATGLSFGKAAASQFADQFRDVTLANLSALADFNLDGLVGTDEFIPSEEELNAAEAEILKIAEALKGVQEVEAEIQSILAQQERLRKSQSQLAIAESQVRALQSRAEAEDVVGPFVSRTSQIDLRSGTRTPGNIVGFLNEENEQLRLQAILRDRLKASVESLGNVQRAVAQNNLDTERQALQFLLLRNAKEIEAIEQTIALNEREAEIARNTLADTSPEDLETIDLLEDQLTLLQQEEIALQRQVEVIRERNQLLEEAQGQVVKEAEEDLARTEDTFANAVLGFREGLEQANEEVGTAYEIAAQTTLAAVQSLSGAIADTIVDAFDPTSDKTLEQRIGAFLQAVAKQLIQLTVQAILLRSVLAGIGGGVGVGAADGGQIPAQGLAAGGIVGAFKRARGYAAGGTVGRSPRRPSGLPASDTTPIWATPGEFMIKRSAVNTYGADAMKAINDMLVDPGSLRSVAGLASRRRSVSRRPKIGFADGGMIGRTAGASTASAAVEAVNMPLVAIPANDATLEALINGGKNAMFAFLQANQNKVKGALNI